MLKLALRAEILAGCLFSALAAASALAAEPPAPPLLAIDALGKGAAPIDGPWQFHLGDDPSWAASSTNDATGTNGWEQISADKTWGMQTHPAYTGYAWYRKHLHLTPAPGADSNFALLIRHIDDVYEIYWNGALIGRNGTMPPQGSFQYGQLPQTFGIGPARDGVLAVRVWKEPLFSFQTDRLGGFHFAPVIGSPEAIADRKAALDYSWMRGGQYFFGLQSLYILIMLFSLVGWLRNRAQLVLLSMAAFTGAPVAVFFISSLGLPIPYNVGLGLIQPCLSTGDIGLWFLLLFLLKLDQEPRLYRFTRILAAISLAAASLDGALTLMDWSNPKTTPWMQMADAVLTVIFTLAEVYPLLLIAFALRKRLDSARWLVAITAFLSEMISVVRIAASQGSRFTHWTISEKIGSPLFSINGNPFTVQTIASTLLLLAIVFAVYHFMQDASRRQSSLEQEFKSARELQQVLIPETLPSLPGFAFTSAYRPAQEVGGDFFQVIPLEGDDAGATLILLGDVSGKGLKAAMTVSLIVGAARTLAKFVHSPAEILTELNTRLFGRMQGGFATCLALRLEADGHCVMASAGHPAPYLNQRELDLPGALPLGVLATVSYEEKSIELKEGDHFALYTDGLLEARSATGEIFSFERLDALFSTAPDAARATEAAVSFGQDDDITVLTLTRLVRGEKSTTQLTAPMLAAGTS